MKKHKKIHFLIKIFIVYFLIIIYYKNNLFDILKILNLKKHKLVILVII